MNFYLTKAKKKLTNLLEPYGFVRLKNEWRKCIDEDITLHILVSLDKHGGEKVILLQLDIYSESLLKLHQAGNAYSFSRPFVSVSINEVTHDSVFLPFPEDEAEYEKLVNRISSGVPLLLSTVDNIKNVEDLLQFMDSYPAYRMLSRALFDELLAKRAATLKV